MLDPVEDVHLLAPAHLVEGVVHDVVLVDAFHEGAEDQQDDGHDQAEQGLVQVHGDLHAAPHVAVQTVLRAVVGQDAEDELHLSALMNADALSRGGDLLVLRQLSVMGRRDTHVFAVHVEHHHVLHVHAVQERLDAWC